MGILIKYFKNLRLRKIVNPLLGNIDAQLKEIAFLRSFVNVLKVTFNPEFAGCSNSKRRFLRTAIDAIFDHSWNFKDLLQNKSTSL